MTDTTSMTPGGAEDRRQFFRVDDTVRLDIRPLDRAELADRLADLEHGVPGNFSVMSSLESVTAQMAANLRRIEARDPDMATYLRALDQKLEILGRAFLAKESELLSRQAQPVNLSAGGVSLHVQEPIAVGQAVEIRMLLFPSFAGLLSYGEVVGCDPLPAGEGGTYTHQLRVEFTHMREQDREALIRHVLRRQGWELRARREEGERSGEGGTGG